MAQQTINVGTAPNDGTGDDLRAGATKTNANFTELYAGKAEASHVHPTSDVTGLDAALAGKAETSHTHTASSVTDFSEAVDDRVAALLVAGANITLTYDDATNTFTIAAAGGSGSGNATITMGAGAPVGNPSATTDLYIDSTNGLFYHARGPLVTDGWQATIPDDASGVTINNSPGGSDEVFGWAVGGTPQITTWDNVIATFGLLTRTLTINAQTGTTYQVAAADAHAKITMDNAAANVLTVPANATTALPVGTIVNVSQIGAGVTTITGATGVSVNGVSAGSAAISDQWTSVTLTKIGTDAWLAEGNHGVFA